MAWKKKPKVGKSMGTAKVAKLSSAGKTSKPKMATLKPSIGSSSRSKKNKLGF